MAKAKQTMSEGQDKIRSVVSAIEEKFGEGIIMKLGDVRKVDVEAIPTGSVSLDIALGIGGVPRGRVVEIYGPESSGKTTLSLHIVANAQKTGGVAAFVDAEHALDPEYAKRIGVNIGDLLMSQALRKLTAIIARSNVVVIFINQIRMKIGIMFGNPETTTGGQALKFYSSVRIEVRRSAQIKKGEVIVGNRTKAKVVKNKVAAPFRTAEFDIMYNEGISFTGDLLDTGVLYGVVKKSGNSFAFGDVKLGVGRETAKAFLKENPKVGKEIEKAILKQAKEGMPETKAEIEE